MQATEHGAGDPHLRHAEETSRILSETSRARLFIWHHASFLDVIIDAGI